MHSYTLDIHMAKDLDLEVFGPRNHIQTSRNTFSIGIWMSRLIYLLLRISLSLYIYIYVSSQ